MKIHFKSSGGFAGLRLNYAADTSQLPTQLAQELTTLVQQSGAFNLRSADLNAASSGPPDVMSYQLELQDGDRHQSLSVTDVTAPESLQPLLARLRDLAIDAP